MSSWWQMDIGELVGACAEAATRAAKNIRRIRNEGLGPTSLKVRIYEAFISFRIYRAWKALDPATKLHHNDFHFGYMYITMGVEKRS